MMGSQYLWKIPAFRARFRTFFQPDKVLICLEKWSRKPQPDDFSVPLLGEEGVWEVI